MDRQESLGITKTFLSTRCAQDCVWLLEDKEFVRSVILGSELTIGSDAFITWLKIFVRSLGFKCLAKKVTATRIKEIIKTRGIVNGAN